MKKSVLVIVITFLLGGGYYLLSPLWKNTTLNDASPLIADRMDTMTEEEKTLFMREVNAMSTTSKTLADTMPVTPLIIAEADFIPRAHDVSGRALLIETPDTHILRFEGFDTVNGPDLHVYIGSSLSDDDFIDLGQIKANKGNINYDLFGDIDLEKYHYVMIWCKPFGVLFSYADLNPEK